MERPALSGPIRSVPAFLVLTSIVVGALALGTVGAGCAGPSGGSAAEAHARVPEGAELFAEHCAVCHGEDGEGDGVAARYLSPPPRDLTGRWYALVSTRGGEPTRADIAQVLERGMPGSAMPSFAFLDERARDELVEHVLSLRPEPRTGDDRRALIDEPPQVPASEAHLARGAELYRQHCASCHGPEGKGGVPVGGSGDRLHEYRPARDFTAGVLRGPVTRREIARRIVAGMPVAGMPAVALEGDDLAAVVDHVLQWIPASARIDLVQTSRSLTAPRVDRLPADADDRAFPPATTLVLSPLAWNPGAIRKVEVSAVHDGNELLVRLSWSDATLDHSAVGSGSGAPDAVAVQWSDAERPPLLSMGSRDEPVEVWFWQAFRPDEIAGYLDAQGFDPGGHHDAARPAARGVVETEQRARGGVAEGPPTHGDLAEERVTIDAKAQRRDGRWSVLMRRSLAAPNNASVDFEPGARSYSFACAVWNGSARDRRGDKSISTWQRVELLD